MEYSKEFKDLVTSSVKKNVYIGIGNPSASILFVGKEASSKGKNGYTEEWKRHIENSTCQILAYPISDKPELKNPGNTWRKYQKLHDYIFKEKEENKDTKNRIDFLENVFTTEMSEKSNPNTTEAQKKPDFKENLKNRRETFFRSDFIKQFPVVVLACGNYIRYYDNANQIEDTFGVVFQEEKGNVKNQKFWTHFNSDKPKLVIHTRQLSGYVSNKLLEGMASEIKQFLEENNLY